MSLTTWFMVRNWSFFEQFSAAELLDRLDQAGVRGLVCTGALPLDPNPTHYVDARSLPKRQRPKSPH